MENDLKDYCITYVPRNLPVDETIMKIKQIFLKLPEESAFQLSKFFENLPLEDKGKFSIEPFSIDFIQDNSKKEI